MTDMTDMTNMTDSSQQLQGQILSARPWPDTQYCRSGVPRHRFRTRSEGGLL
ncbi:MAG: hypothetical protein ACI9W6_001131 [Motiliproteus sp.]|jgi:hypothetical protein